MTNETEQKLEADDQVAQAPAADDTAAEAQSPDPSLDPPADSPDTPDATSAPGAPGDIEIEVNADVPPSAEPAAEPAANGDPEPAPQDDAPAEAATESDDAAGDSADAGESEPSEPAPASSVASVSGAKASSSSKSGPTLAGAGVATSRPAPPSSKRKPKKKKGDDGSEEEEPFDPASDLPMYREGMDWFVLRVASNKENYVRDTLLRKVQIEGLEIRVGRIMVPTEKTKTLKGGRARITETKLYPGYIFVEMKLEDDGRIPQDVFFLIKETTGVGDFVGTAGRPTPMSPGEVEKMLFDSRRPEETPTVKMEFDKGDNVTITEGPFENYDGTVDEVLPDKGRVRVLVTIFGRQAPIDLEYWQIQKAE